MTDVLITDHGSIILFEPLTPAATAFLTENTSEEAQWFGHALCVEPRYARDLAQGLVDEGFLLKGAR